jgi:hypothetical protein
LSMKWLSKLLSWANYRKKRCWVCGRPLSPGFEMITSPWTNEPVPYCAAQAAQ